MCVRSKFFFLYVGLYFFPFNMICNRTTFRKNNILPFDPTPQVEGVCKDRICACMVLFTPFTLIWYASWHRTFRFFLFWSFDPPLGQDMCLHGALCSIPISLICNMTTFRIFFDLWPHPRDEGWVLGQNMYLHVAAFVTPFNLICNMTMFWKSWILTFWPQPKGSGRVSKGKMFSTILINASFL